MRPESDAMEETILGYSASAVTCAILVPQIIKALRTRSVKDVSWLMIALHGCADSLWIAYGVVSGNMPLLVTGLVTCSNTLTLAAVKAMLERSECEL